MVNRSVGPYRRWPLGPRLVRAVCAVLAVITAVVLVMAGPGVAGAHAALIYSAPESGARVTQQPAFVRLSFNERILQESVAVRVKAPDGQQVGEEGIAPVVTGPQVILLLRSAELPGIYEVSYRIVSVDDHSVTGRFSYELLAPRPSAPDTSAVMAAPAELDTVAPTDRRILSTMGWTLTVLFGLLSAVVVVRLLLRRRAADHLGQPNAR